MLTNGSASGLSEKQSHQSAAESVGDPTPKSKQPNRKEKTNHAKTQSFGNAEASERGAKPAVGSQMQSTPVEQNNQGVDQDKHP